MNVFIILNHCFYLSPDDMLWTKNPSVNYEFWTRYLDIFDNVTIIARAMPVKQSEPGWHKTTGLNVTGYLLPHFQGPESFIANYTEIRRNIKFVVTNVNSEAIIFRVPCSIGTEIWKSLPIGKPYGLEVVTDPYDNFAPGAVKHPLRFFFRWLFTTNLRKQCQQASGVAYVTAHALQKRYPTQSFSTHYSSIKLTSTKFKSQPHTYTIGNNAHSLITVGNQEHLYKAPDVLIKAVAICINNGLNLHLTLVGDGKHRVELEGLAQQLGISEKVTFTGHLCDSIDVQNKLDQADLFVLPSHQEGLPRAMIEAMARGLPCIGSTVGGIPELLAAENMVLPGNADALARKIEEVVTNPERMNQMAAENLDKAQEYHEERLRQRRNEFYTHIKNETQLWLQTKK